MTVGSVSMTAVLCGAQERLLVYGWSPYRASSVGLNGPLTLRQAVAASAMDGGLLDERQVDGCLWVIARHLEGDEADKWTVENWLNPLDRPRTAEEVATMLGECAQSLIVLV